MGDAREHLAQARFRVQTGEFCCADQAVDRCCALASGIRSTKQEFKLEVEKHLTGQETEPWEIIYFKVCKNQLPTIKQPLGTAGLMLGNDRSRGYWLEMICADFLVGASLESDDQSPVVVPLLKLVRAPLLGMSSAGPFEMMRASSNPF
jgi:hypothetical protein